MFIIQTKDDTPVYVQLQHQVLDYIALGILKKDDQLPSVRTLSKELGINPNTVAKAYQDLEKSGLIYSVAGKGSFISGEETLDRQVAVSVLDHLREAIREARSSGVDRQTALILIDEVYKEGNAQ